MMGHLLRLLTTFSDATCECKHKFNCFWYISLCETKLVTNNIHRINGIVKKRKMDISINTNQRCKGHVSMNVTRRNIHATDCNMKLVFFPSQISKVQSDIFILLLLFSQQSIIQRHVKHYHK